MARRKPAAPPALLSEAEWKVMRCLWRRHPASARELLVTLHAETGWAYTTLKTVLTRLVEKGAVSERKRANASQYEPLVAEVDARRSAVRSLVDRAFDGTFGSLVHFMFDAEGLTAKDRAALAKLLPELERGNRAERRHKRA
jgi:BlaI family transcriptional regulator, penicillinase repressor